MNDWILLENELPPLGETVWLYVEGEILIGERFDSGEEWLWSIYYSVPNWTGTKWDGEPQCDDEYKVSHWMRLPVPPI